MGYRRFICWLAVFGLFAVFLQTQYAFHFFYIEQNQLFENTWHYVADHLFQPGGLAFLTSGFLVQFFILPYGGAVILSLLLTSAGLFTSLVLRQIAPSAKLSVLGFLPAILLLFIQFDFNYFTQGTVAFVFAVATLWAVLHVSTRKRRLITHFIATALLFYLAGPVYILYAVCAVLYEYFDKSPRNYPALLLLPAAALIGLGSVYFQCSPQYRMAFLPDAYYHSKQIPPIHIYFSWISLAALILVARLMKKQTMEKKKGVLWLGVQAVSVAALCVWGIPRYDDSKSYRVKELDYYCRTGQWDKIVERSKGPLTNYLYMCYLNIALMEKGELAEKMFSYDQRGPQGIMVEWNKTVPVSTLLNDIYFAVNHISLAQEMAFEANIGSMASGNPRMLKRLVQTNLIYGSYPVAEKYIKILENTWNYKAWAKDHRRFLYHDDAVANDSLLGGKRKSLLPESTLSKMNGLDWDMIQTAIRNPRHNSTLEFLGGSYLLAKDMQNFNALIQTYYGTELLPVLPKSFQEAIITLHESDPGQWAEYHVSQATVKRFGEFKKQILANKSNPSVLPGLLNRAYGDTFWFYFMFK